MDTLRNPSSRRYEDARVGSLPPFFLWGYLALACLLYVIGFLIGEDSMGGLIRDDLYLYHGPTMFAFRAKPFLAVLPDYSSATTPLFQFLESLNPLLGHDLPFRATNALFNLLVCCCFALVLRARFRSTCDIVSSAPMLAAAILFSPYFRAESYWVSTDVFPVFLVILTAWLINPIQDLEIGPTVALPPVLLMLLTSIVSWSAFYCRQTYLFLPFFAFALLCVKFPRLRIWAVLCFGVLGLPAVYLFQLWHGLTPPAFRHHQGFSAEAIAAPLSMVLIYAIPFLAELVLRALRDPARRTSIPRTVLYWIGAGLLVFLAAFHSFRFNDKNEGGGIASKTLSHFGVPGRYLFLTFAYAGLVILFYMFRSASWRGRILVFSFFLPAFIMTVFYQRYYDPLLVVLFYVLWEKASVQSFLTVRTAVLLAAFNAILLGGALGYNRHKPIFQPVIHAADHVAPVVEDPKRNRLANRNVPSSIIARRTGP